MQKRSALSHGLDHLNSHGVPCNGCKWAYSQSGYPKGRSNEKGLQRTTKDYFEFLLHLLFYDYCGLVYDYK
jgi:hypothetical protein